MFSRIQAAGNTFTTLDGLPKGSAVAFAIGFGSGITPGVGLSGSGFRTFGVGLLSSGFRSFGVGLLGSGFRSTRGGVL